MAAVAAHAPIGSRSSGAAGRSELCCCGCRFGTAMLYVVGPGGGFGGSGGGECDAMDVSFAAAEVASSPHPHSALHKPHAAITEAAVPSPTPPLQHSEISAFCSPPHQLSPPKILIVCAHPASSAAPALDPRFLGLPPGKNLALASASVVAATLLHRGKTSGF